MEHTLIVLRRRNLAIFWGILWCGKLGAVCGKLPFCLNLTLLAVLKMKFGPLANLADVISHIKFYEAMIHSFLFMQDFISFTGGKAVEYKIGFIAI